jgi:adenylosuccinate lyase
MKAWKEKTSFLGLLKADANVKAHLSDKELESLFDYNYFMRHVDSVFSRLGLTGKKKTKTVKAAELAPRSL